MFQGLEVLRELSISLLATVVFGRFSYKSTAGKEVALSISESFAATWCKNGGSTKLPVFWRGNCPKVEDVVLTSNLSH